MIPEKKYFKTEIKKEKKINQEKREMEPEGENIFQDSHQFVGKKWDFVLIGPTFPMIYCVFHNITGNLQGSPNAAT